VSGPCTVLIAAADLLPTLKQRFLDADSELLAFADTEALKALDAISRRRPSVVTLERAFAATPRGAALINRIKADPTLTGSEIRVVSHDTDDTDVVSPATTPSDHAAGPASAGPAAPAAVAPPAAPAPGGPTSAAVAAPAPAAVAAPAPSVVATPAPSVVAAPAAPGAAPLDQRGTRRAPRFKLVGNVEVVADGNAATLIDLSTVGAQIMSAYVLKPNQKLRMTIADEQATIRVSAVVAWALFEIPPESGPRYRAGIEFIDAKAAEVDAFRVRHQA
jgi:hypothetical protein